MSHTVYWPLDLDLSARHPQEPNRISAIASSHNLWGTKTPRHVHTNTGSVQQTSLRAKSDLVAAPGWFCAPSQPPTRRSGCSECTSSWPWQPSKSPYCGNDRDPFSSALGVKASSSSQTHGLLLTYTACRGSPGHTVGTLLQQPLSIDKSFYLGFISIHFMFYLHQFTY